jgi:hypothetical protein
MGGREQDRKHAKQNGSGVPVIRHVARLPCCVDSAKPSLGSIKILVPSRS